MSGTQWGSMRIGSNANVLSAWAYTDRLKGFSAEKFQTERVVMRATERCTA